MGVKALAVFVSLVIHTAVASLLFLKTDLETKEEIKEVSLSSIKLVKPKAEKKANKIVKKKTIKRKNKAIKRVREVKRVVKRERAKRETKARVSKEAKRVKEIVNKSGKSEAPTNGKVNAVASLEERKEEISEDTARGSILEKNTKGSERDLRKIQEGKKTEELSEVKRLSKESSEEYGERFREENLEVIRELVSSNIRYPSTARRMGWEGTVILRFKLLPSGKLDEVSVLKSSGYKLLDRNAVKALKESEGKLPKPQRAVVVELPIVYSLF